MALPFPASHIRSDPRFVLGYSVLPGANSRGHPATDRYVGLHRYGQIACCRRHCVLRTCWGQEIIYSAGKKFTELKGLDWQERMEHIIHLTLGKCVVSS